MLCVVLLLTFIELLLIGPKVSNKSILLLLLLSSILLFLFSKEFFIFILLFKSNIFSIEPPRNDSLIIKGFSSVSSS